MLKRNIKNYFWWRDKKILGIILLISVLFLQFFAWFKIPFLSSINGYTVGMFIGFYNPFFYIFFAYIALTMIFGEKIKPPKWFKLNVFSYWLVTISIVFIGVSSTFYQSKTGYTSIGLTPWKSFEKWFENFKGNSAWTPNNTNGGILGAFMYSFFAMISSGIGALIFAILLMLIIISYIITGSSIGFYKHLKLERKSKINEIVKTNRDKIELGETTTKKLNDDKNISEDLPFDDPF